MTRDDQTDLRKNRTYPAAIRLCISPLTSRPLCNGAPSCVCVCVGRPAVLGAER
eukprot:COSAG03_NODE_645_length_6513_cov_2.546999_4_plen_54_part_00